MDLNDLAVYKALTKKMEWDHRRQLVLSENIANANTPGYKSNDLKPFETTFRQMLNSHTAPVAPMTTKGNHLVGSNARSREMGETQVQDPYEITPDGNSVSLEEQLIKMNEVTTDYQTVTNLYKKHTDMLKLILRPN